MSECAGWISIWDYSGSLLISKAVLVVASGSPNFLDVLHDCGSFPLSLVTTFRVPACLMQYGR